MKRLPTWLEINLDTLDHNLEQIQHHVGKDVSILLTVKADAYGHGAVQVARAAAPRVRMFGVATVDEGAELREAGIKNHILILSPILETEIARGCKARPRHHHFIPGHRHGGGDGSTRAGDRRARGSRHRDGTHRRPGGNRRSTTFAAIATAPGVRLRGIYTHFPVSDTDPQFTKAQITRFLSLIEKLRASGVDPGLVHSANTAAIDAIAESRMNMIRPGLLAYGLHPFGAAAAVNVRPIMSWKSRIARVRRFAKGSTISYARSFVTERDSLIGVVPVGYGHGYPFHLSGRGFVLVSGMRVPIVGRVTMDMTMVDLTDVPNAPRAGRRSGAGRDARKANRSPSTISRAGPTRLRMK
jgi:alanine racemase